MRRFASAKTSAARGEIEGFEKEGEEVPGFSGSNAESCRAEARVPMSLRAKIAGAFLGLLVLLLLLSALAAYVAYDVWTYGGVDETRKADAALVLGASAWGNKPSPVFEERLKHAILLYKNGFVGKLLITGGKGKGAKRADSSVGRDYAVRNSVPSGDVLIEEESTTTMENLHYAAGIAKANGLSSVLIVSDPLHMRRAMRMAKDVGFDAYASPTLSSKFMTRKAKTDFLVREVLYNIGYTFLRLAGDAGRN